MTDLDPRTLPASPPSEVEWEDLLVRLEIMPRALRLAVEDAPADSDAAVARALRFGVAMESSLQKMLEAMVDGRDLSVPGAAGAGVNPTGTPQELLAEYARLRMRNFVMVQRRGLNVWEWTVCGGPWHGATAYQLFQFAAQADGALLAGIRRAGRQEPAA